LTLVTILRNVSWFYKDIYYINLFNTQNQEHNWLVGGLEHEFYGSIQLGMSSSQLTKSIIFQRGRAQPPTRLLLILTSTRYQLGINPENWANLSRSLTAPVATKLERPATAGVMRPTWLKPREELVKCWRGTSKHTLKYQLLSFLGIGLELVQHCVTGWATWLGNWSSTSTMVKLAGFHHSEGWLSEIL
jgi:hypothetical protein